MKKKRGGVDGVVGRLGLAVVVALCAVLGSGRAWAQGLIGPGREAEVLALLRPYALGGEVVPGWSLQSVSIRPTRIVCGLRGPQDEASLTLGSPSDRGPQSASFSLSSEASSAAAEEALGKLRDAVIRNDGGKFWGEAPVNRATAGAAQQTALLREQGGRWARDGALVLALLAAALAAMLVREVMEGPRWLGPALLGVLALSAVLRLLLPVETTLDVWPYSRQPLLVRLLFEGETLRAWSEWRRTEVPLQQLLFRLQLVLAAVTPLAFFTHVRPLLRDHRLGVMAVTLVALLPSHIRFARSDTSFIPSLVLSSVCFGLVHRVATERVWAWRVPLALALMPLLWVTLQTRPLNVLFLPLFLGQLWLHHRDSSQQARIALGALVSAVCLAHFFGPFAAEFGARALQELHPALLVSVLASVVSPTWNTLLHPWITPPALVVLAIVALRAHRSGEKAVQVRFLLGWLLLFFAAHAVVMPTHALMQARYHLHLVAPLCMLAVLGLGPLLERRRTLAIVAVISLVLSPLLHLGYIRDVDRSDIREFELARRAAALVPDGCTVIESVGPFQALDARLARFAAVLRSGQRLERFTSVILSDQDTPPGAKLTPAAQALLAAPPACLLTFEGLPCLLGRGPEEPRTARCQALREAASLEPLLTERFRAPPYDSTFESIPETELLELGLYRVHPR